jgi:predicted DNA binding CopG/RHH family protein
VNQKKSKAVRVNTPAFRSEEEEAQWWDEHPELIADLIVRHGRPASLPTKPVSIRLPVTDIEKAREIADRRGLPYQTLLKLLIHEALRKAR